MIYTMCIHISMKIFASTFALLFALLLRNEYICLQLRILLGKCEWGNRYGPFKFIRCLAYQNFRKSSREFRVLAAVLLFDSSFRG
jgi:hypothetical protein